MVAEVLPSPEDKDWLVRDIELASQAARLTLGCQLDYLIGPLDRLFPDATTATEALVSLAIIYDHDINEVASVLAEVLVDSQNVPVTIERFVPLADSDTILTSQDGHRFRIGRTDHEELRITLPDGWDPSRATAEDLDRRANIAGDIAIYFSTGIERQVGQRSPVFTLEATKSIEPFVLYAEDLENKAKAACIFEQDTEQALSLVQVGRSIVQGPTEANILESHLRADFYRSLGQLQRAIVSIAA